MPPDDVGPNGAHGPDRLADAPEGLLALPIGHTQAFFAPEAVDPLVVDPPTGLLGGHRRPAPTPARTAPREVPQEGPQRQLVVGGNRGWEPLGGAGLADHPAGSPFCHPELRLQGHDGPPATVRGQKFPRFNSFSMSMSRA